METSRWWLINRSTSLNKHLIREQNNFFLLSSSCSEKRSKQWKLFPDLTSKSKIVHFNTTSRKSQEILREHIIKLDSFGFLISCESSASLCNKLIEDFPTKSQLNNDLMRERRKHASLLSFNIIPQSFALNSWCWVVDWWSMSLGWDTILMYVAALLVLFFCNGFPGIFEVKM